MTDTQQLLELALKIARQAGDLLVNRPASWDLTVKSTAIDIATQMDLASEKLIVESIVTAALSNSAPLAVAGPNQTVTLGSAVILDGRNSTDTDQDRLFYTWKLASKPSTSTKELSEADSKAGFFTFLPDKSGPYIFSLVVSDGKDTGNSFTVITANPRPVAVSGPAQWAKQNATVTLDARLSTPSDLITAFKWVLLSAPTGSNAPATLTGIQPTFAPNTYGTYIYSLTVTDGYSDSLPSATVAVVITVNVSGLQGES